MSTLQAIARPGDILLYQGSDVIAKIIRELDQKTKVNHAALYLGNNTVAEVICPSIVSRSFGQSRASKTRVFVYRLRGENEIAPVLNRAYQYLKEKDWYAVHQLLLLALLCIYRHGKKSIPAILYRAASVLCDFIDHQRQPMICSEFVYRCYDEALPEQGDQYSLKITSPTRAAHTRGPQDSLLDSAEQYFMNYQQLSNAKSFKLTEEPAESEQEIGNLFANKQETETELNESSIMAAVGTFALAYQKAASCVLDLTNNLKNITPILVNCAEAIAGTAWDRLRSLIHPTNFASDAYKAIKHLKDVNPNFVTPGDLQRCQQLEEVGEVDP